MAEFYQLPDGNSNNGIPFSIPIGGNNGGLFGNGNSSLVDLFGFAIIASMFGWNNGGFGGFGGNGANGAGFISNQLNNDSGRELLMNAITTQGESQRSAIQNLATMVGQDFNIVNTAIQSVQGALANIAAQQGTTSMQIINAVQGGNAALMAQLQQACCQQQLAMAQQTFALQQGINGIGQQISSKAASDNMAMCQLGTNLREGATQNTQAILAKLDAMETRALQDKLDAARAENAKLASEISQQQQNATIAAMIGNAIAPINAALGGIRGEVDAIKRCQPSTITLPNNSMTAVPTIWANAVADNFVDKVSTALTPTAAPTTTGASA